MKVLIIGSGPITIGQAAEFDYAGSQACRALPIRTYQYHPEGAPGPRDNEPVFDRFLADVRAAVARP